jgi:hypothetical protein
MGWLRKIAWSLLWKWFRSRLMEKSTWIGIFALLAAFGLPVNPDIQDKLAFVLAESVEGDFLQLEYLQALVTVLGALLGGTLIVVKEKGQKAGEPAASPLADTTFGAGEAGKLSAEQIRTLKVDVAPRPLSDKVKNAKRPAGRGRGGRR